MPADPLSIHDRAIILSTGDEIVLGQLLDTNARALARRLVDRGIKPIEHVSVADDLPALVATLRRVCTAAPLVIMSGGLGPTDGDLTRQAVCELTGDALILDAAQRQILADLLARRNRPMNERQERQAFRPSRATCLPNAFGTAPGLHVRVPSPDAPITDLFCLPGPPGELFPMFDSSVLPVLRTDSSRTILIRLLHVAGLAEAECVNRLGDLTRRDRTPLVGITASGGILTIRIRSESTLPRDESLAQVDDIERQVRAELGDHVFAQGDAPGTRLLAQSVLDTLKARHQTLAVVESCTGGMLGEMLTAIPGSSAAFLGGHITYSNALKQHLGVPKDIIERFGAVSRECATHMAITGLQSTRADYAVAITGIAGPDGGTLAKPVGTVHIAISRGAERFAHTSIDVRRFLFTGNRDDVRQRACITALAMLHFQLHAGSRPALRRPLLWEINDPA